MPRSAGGAGKIAVKGPEGSGTRVADPGSVRRESHSNRFKGSVVFAAIPETSGQRAMGANRDRSPEGRTDLAGYADISPAHTGGYMSRAQVETFFGSQLPGVIAHQRDMFRTLRGSITIIVEGASAWTVKFGDPDAPDVLVEDLDFEADCIGVWTVESFCALLDGNSDLTAIAPCAVEGDERLLSRLGSLMVPAQRGAVNARLAAFAA